MPERAAHRIEQALARLAEIALRGEREVELVPYEVCAVNLFEQTGADLEYDGVGERHHPTGRHGAGEFHEMEAHEADVDDFARRAAHLNAIADADSELSDQKEIPDDRDDDALHGDRDARGDKPGECDQRADAAREGESDDDRHEKPEYEAAHQQELVAAALIGHIAIHRAAPQLRSADDDEDQRAQRADAHDEALQVTAECDPHGGLPAVEVPSIELEQFCF